MACSVCSLRKLAKNVEKNDFLKYSTLFYSVSSAASQIPLFRRMLVLKPVAKFFLNLRLRDIVEIWDCRTGPPDFVVWRPGTTSPWQSRLYPPSQGLRIWLKHWYFRNLKEKLFREFRESTLFSGPSSSPTPEPVFLNVYGAQKSIPRNEFRQPM